MIRRPPRSTRTDTLFPYTTLFRSDPGSARCRSAALGRDDNRLKIVTPVAAQRRTGVPFSALPDSDRVDQRIEDQLAVEHAEPFLQPQAGRRADEAVAVAADIVDFRDRTGLGEIGRAHV